MDTSTLAENIPNPKGKALSGPEVIRQAVANMPSGCGVYRMLDAKGNALYVGKARNLKNRVASYLNTPALGARIARMVELTAQLEVTVTAGEAEALLLEGNFIKRLRPRYNILLKDDKSFPYILLTGDQEFSQIKKHRGAQSQKGTYFGPFASAQAVNETLATLQRAFLLRPCPDTVFKNRNRPCLQYQIKRCSAPCVGYIGQVEYAERMDEANAFLSGKSREIQDKLTGQMQEASVAQDYEKAAQLRDRLRALTRIQREQNIHMPTMPQADVIALHREGPHACIQVVFFRAGQNYGNQAFFPSYPPEATDSDIFSAFITQFYQSNEPPRHIVLSHWVEDESLLREALSLRTSYTVQLIHPQKGEKMEALSYAQKNARESLLLRLSQHAAQRELLEKLVETFGLEAPPKRIEVYDNSHTMGTDAVGSMIVAGPEGFIKKAYRKFTIKNKAAAPGDDYAMLREVLTRRLMRLQREDPDRESNQWPDLLVIDGGAGQMSAAAQVMAELGIGHLPYIGIAKGVDRNAGKEQFFMPGRAPFRLPEHDAVLHYLQRLRDEAHRFAIGTHRNKRSASLVRSELDAIEGIGPNRKRALLHHFGSAREVAQASLTELGKVTGINKKTAQMIYNHFHPNG